MLKKILLILLSVIIFIVSFVLLLNFLPTLLLKPEEKAFPPLSAQLSPYIVDFNTAFKKTEMTLPKVPGNHSLLLAPRSDILQQQSELVFFTQNSKNYSRYTNTTSFTPEKKRLYNTEYLIENALRRVGKVPTLKRSEYSLVFVGCSFTFGEGVAFENTLPGIFEKNYPHINVYSLGIGGMALNDHYYLLEQNLHTLSQSLGNKVILVYVFMDDHIFRESCSSACVSNAHSWRLAKPRYEVVNNELVFAGAHNDVFYNNTFTRLVFDSNLMRNRHYPELHSEANFIRHQKLLISFYQQVKKHQDVVAAYDFMGFGNDSGLLNRIVPYVLHTPFSPIVLNYYNADFNQGLQPYIIPYDGHPSALGYEASYYAVLSRLKKDFPSLF